MVSACLEAYRATSDRMVATKRPSAPSTGSWAGTTSAWNSTPPAPAAAAMHCTWIGSTETRARNPPSPSFCRSRKCRLTQNALTSFTSRLTVGEWSVHDRQPRPSNAPDGPHPTARGPARGRFAHRKLDAPERICAQVMALPEAKSRLARGHVRRVRERHGRSTSSSRDASSRSETPCARASGSPKSGELLIGAYFLAEYSLECAALFNPSIVPHPDQPDCPRDALRFILSLRATGEGHISSDHLSNRHQPPVATSGSGAGPASCLTEPRRCPTRPTRRTCSSESSRARADRRFRPPAFSSRTAAISFTLEELRAATDAATAGSLADGDPAGGPKHGAGDH